jgi:hypothetical protein
MFRKFVDSLYEGILFERHFGRYKERVFTVGLHNDWQLSAGRTYYDGYHYYLNVGPVCIGLSYDPLPDEVKLMLDDVEHMRELQRFAEQIHKEKRGDA